MALGQSRLSLFLYVSFLGCAVTVSHGSVTVPEARGVVDTAPGIAGNRRGCATKYDDQSVQEDVQQPGRVPYPQSNGGSPGRLPRTATFPAAGPVTPYQGAPQNSGVRVKDVDTKREAPETMGEDPDTWLESPDPAAEHPGPWWEPPDPAAKPSSSRPQGGGVALPYVGTFVEHAGTVPNMSRVATGDEGADHKRPADEHKGPSVDEHKGPSALEGHKGPSTLEERKGSSVLEGHKGPSVLERRKGPSVLERRKGPSVLERHKGPSTPEDHSPSTPEGHPAVVASETKTSAQSGYQDPDRSGQDRPGTEHYWNHGNPEVHQIPKLEKGHVTLNDDSDSQERPLTEDGFPETVPTFLHSTTAATTDFNHDSSRGDPLAFGGGAVDRVYALSPPEVGLKRRWIAYFHDQAIAIILQEGDGTIVNCTLREVITVGEQRAALVELGLALPLVPVSFHHMVHLVTLCGALDQLSDEDDLAGPSSAGNAWWLFLGTNILAGILPGTLWCGMGDQARNYHQLGPNRRLDRCCRAHDHCPIKVRPHTRRYGVTNDGWNTKSHCACDLEFHRCLKESRMDMADTVGRVYFNYLQVPCLQEVSEPLPPPPPFSRFPVDHGNGKTQARQQPVKTQEGYPWETSGQQRNSPWKRRLECARWDHENFCRLWLSNPRGNTVRHFLVPPQQEY